MDTSKLRSGESACLFFSSLLLRAQAWSGFDWCCHQHGTAPITQREASLFSFQKKSHLSQKKIACLLSLLFAKFEQIFQHESENSKLQILTNSEGLRHLVFKLIKINFEKILNSSFVCFHAWEIMHSLCVMRHLCVCHTDGALAFRE